MCMDILSANRSLHHVHVWQLQRPKEGIWCPGTGMELQSVVSCHVSGENQTQVFWKNSPCSSPKTYFYYFKLHVCSSVHVSAQRPEASDLPVEFQVLVSCLLCMLGNELEFSL